MSRSEYREVDVCGYPSSPTMQVRFDRAAWAWQYRWKESSGVGWVTFCKFDGINAPMIEAIWDALPDPAEPPESEWELVRWKMPGCYERVDGSLVYLLGSLPAIGYSRWNGSLEHPKLVPETRPVRWVVEE